MEAGFAPVGRSPTGSSTPVGRSKRTGRIVLNASSVTYTTGWIGSTHMDAGRPPFSLSDATNVRAPVVVLRR